MNLEPIGHIRTAFKEKFGTPRQGSLAPSSSAVIELRSQLPEGSLEGLKDFSHIWILFGFHQNQTSKIKGKIFPPRLNGQSMGWAATRTPHRPNAIGLTLAELEKVDAHSIFVKGVDMVDQTPVFDIKPYIADYDRPQSFSEGWTAGMREKKLEVQWSPQAQKKREEWSLPREILSLVEESFCQDPRPQTKAEKMFSSHIAHWDFHFQVKDDLLIIEDISWLS